MTPHIPNLHDFLFQIEFFNFVIVLKMICCNSVAHCDELVVGALKNFSIPPKAPEKLIHSPNGKNARYVIPMDIN